MKMTALPLLTVLDSPEVMGSGDKVLNATGTDYQHDTSLVPLNRKATHRKVVLIGSLIGS